MAFTPGPETTGAGSGIGQGLLDGMKARMAADEQRQQSKLELAMLSRRLEIENANRMAQQENELKQQLAYAPQIEAAKRNALPKVGDAEIAALKAMLGPRATKDQLGQLEGLRGQPIQNLDQIANAAKSFRSGNAGMLQPVRDANGVQVGFMHWDDQGTPHQIDIPGAGQKSIEAGVIPQYQAAVKKMMMLHDLLTESSTGSGPTLQALSEGKLGGAFASLQARHGYNDIAAELEGLQKSTAGLATRVLEQVPGSRLSQNILNLTQSGAINPGAKNSVVHKLGADFLDIADQQLGQLRQPVTIGGSPVAEPGAASAPAAQAAVPSPADIDKEMARRAALRAQNGAKPQGKR